jgi:hypothetical protein
VGKASVVGDKDKHLTIQLFQGKSTPSACFSGETSPKQRILNFFRNLKRQCHEIFDFRFLHESVSPKPLGMPLGLFRIFLVAARGCTTGVVDTGGKWKKSSKRKISIMLCEH